MTRINKSYTVFADRIKYIPGVNSVFKEIILVLMGSLLIAACARLTIYLPYSPVPVTAQTFSVLIIGMMYGRIRAVATVFAYLTEGALGMQVFAGNHFGIMYMIGPTGGYLLGFLVASYYLGAMAEKKFDRSFTLSLIAMGIGTGIIFFFGIAWMIALLNISVLKAIEVGFIPFIASALTSVLTASVTLPLAWKFIQKK